MKRRALVMMASLMLASGCAPARTESHARRWAMLQRRCMELEASLGGRLGVVLLDDSSGERADYRADERFPMCSTFKWLAAAALLARVDSGQDTLSRRVRFGRDKLVPYSPATAPHAGADGMTLAELCEATITLSDNTAGNLVLEAIGGPEGFTRFARGIGDDGTRLDRVEPHLNESLPGDERDTTTPAAMAHSLRRVLLGDALSPGSRAHLTGWMLACRTSGDRLRAGLPAGWRLADKTGTGERGSTSDVGVFWPASAGPVVAVVYVRETQAPLTQRNAAIAGMARLVLDEAGSAAAPRV